MARQVRRSLVGRSVIALAVFASLFVVARVGLAVPSAQEVVRSTSDQILSKLKEKHEEIKADPSRIYGFVEVYVLPHFDFYRMSQLVLGKHWRRASESQRREFADEFRRLLVRTYASAMFEYSDEPISYLPFRDGGDVNRAVVRTEIRKGDGTPVPIDYSLYLSDGAWMVYDVSIDGVSLVVNYRTSFSSEIGQGSIDALIEKLRTRNAEVIK